MQQEGTQDFWDYSSDEFTAAISRLPPQHSLHMDLCAAFLREGKPDLAEQQLQRAVAMRYFLPGLVDNHRACIAALRGDFLAAQGYLETALRHYPHRVVVRNLAYLEHWMARESEDRSRFPQLSADQGFETACVWKQPEFPDPLNLHIHLHGAGSDA